MRAQQPRVKLPECCMRHSATYPDCKNGDATVLTYNVTSSLKLSEGRQLSTSANHQRAQGYPFRQAAHLTEPHSIRVTWLGEWLPSLVAPQLQPDSANKLPGTSSGKKSTQLPGLITDDASIPN